MFLTVCYIAKNESRNLAESLATIHSIANRILVVDTGSMDDTIAVAKQFGAEVLSFPWQKDFAAARNFALDHVAQADDSNHWILFLDADESLPRSDGFRQMIEELDDVQPTPEAVLLTLVNVDADAEDLEISRFHALRLWRHRPQYRYRGAIHEVLVDTRTGRPPEPATVDHHFLVRHTGYSSARMRKKLVRNLVMLKEDVRAHGGQPLTLRYLAECYYGLGRYEEAASHARRALAAHVATVAGDRGLYDLLLRSLRKIGRPIAEQQAVVHEALAHLSGRARAEFIGWQGRLLLASGDAAQAHAALSDSLAVLAGDAAEEEAGSSGAVAELPELYAADAQALYALEKDEEAEKQAMTALASNPYTEEALDVLLDCGKDAAAFLSCVLPCYPSKEKGASFLADFAERRGHAALRAAVAEKFSEEERCARAPMTALFEMASAGDWDGLMQGLPIRAGRVVQELFAALVLLPENRRHAQPERYAEWLAALPAGMRRLLERLHDEDLALSQEDEETFFTTLDAIADVATEAQLLPYAALAGDFGPAALLRMAHWLHEHRMEAAAFELLQQIPAAFLEDAPVAADFWYLTGRALYALGAEGAQECFERAEAAGCKEPQLAFYLHWADVGMRGEQGA